MALPRFEKAGVAPVTLSRANVRPKVSPRVFNRFVGISDANTVKVATVGPPLQSITLSFRQLSETDRKNVEDFLSHPFVNWGAETFQFIDADGVSHNVKFLEPQYADPEVSADNVSIDLILTKV